MEACVCTRVCVCMSEWACACVYVYRDWESFLRVEVDEQMCRVRNGACHARPDTRLYCNFSGEVLCTLFSLLSPSPLFPSPFLFFPFFFDSFFAIADEWFSCTGKKKKKLEKVMMICVDVCNRTNRCKNIKFRAIRMACMYIYIYIYTSAWNMLTRPIVYSEQSLFTGLGDCVASVLIDWLGPVWLRITAFEATAWTIVRLTNTFYRYCLTRTLDYYSIISLFKLLEFYFLTLDKRFAYIYR